MTLRDGSVTAPFNDLATALENPLLESGDTIFLLDGTHRLSANVAIAANGITVKPLPGARAVIDMQTFDMDVSGDSVTFENLEIMSSDTRRVSEQTGSYPTDIGRGWINVTGADFSMRGCYLHDIQQFGWWQHAYRGVMRDCLLHNIGWDAPDRRHGHLMYGQHAGATERLVDNCIFGQSYGFGVHFYGSSPRLDNLTLRQFVQYGCQFIIGGEAACPSVDGITLDECLFFGVGVNLGYNATADALGVLTLTDNYFGLNGRTIKDGFNVTETGTVTKSSGTNDIFVYPCTTVPKVAHIHVFNWQELDTVSVDVSALSLTQDVNYRLRNASAPLTDYNDFMYDGSGSISVNMVDRSVATPIGAAAPLVTWDKRFGAFVLEAI